MIVENRGCPSSCMARWGSLFALPVPGASPSTASSPAPVPIVPSKHPLRPSPKTRARIIQLIASPTFLCLRHVHTLPTPEMSLQSTLVKNILNPPQSARFFASSTSTPRRFIPMATVLSHNEASKHITQHTNRSSIHPHPLVI